MKPVITRVLKDEATRFEKNIDKESDLKRKPHLRKDNTNKKKIDQPISSRKRLASAFKPKIICDLNSKPEEEVNNKAINPKNKLKSQLQPSNDVKKDPQPSKK